MLLGAKLGYPVGSYTQLLQAALSRAHHGLNMADRPVNRGVGLVQERKHAALGDSADISQIQQDRKLKRVPPNFQVNIKSRTAKQAHEPA